MLDTSTNLSKVSREQMVATLTDMKALHPEQTEALNQILTFVKSQKYGLNFEKHIEQVDIDLQNHLPVFKPFKQIDNGSPEDGYNFLLEGDNLHSLKLLEKTHTGAVDVIYIDPPYNTLHEDFSYGDKMISEDDGFKHSKWLSFMEERLEIAKKLLSDTGVIFMSIDDHENAALKLLCDEIFSEENFVANAFVLDNLKGKANTNFITSVGSKLLVYVKNREAWGNNGFNAIENVFSEKVENKYRLEDEFGKYADVTFKKTGQSKYRTDRPYMFYPILEKNGILYPVTKEEFERIFDAATNTFDDKYLFELKEKYKGYNFILPTDSNGEYLRWTSGYPTFCKKINQDIYYHNGVKQKSRPEATELLQVYASGTPKSLLYKPEYSMGTSDYITTVGNNLFDFPKPVQLIKDVLAMLPNKEALVLDFFAGSGTTAQAVLELNHEDGGQRKFILCTNNEITGARTLEYLHNNGYMLNYNPSKNTKNSVINSKIRNFFEQNKDVQKNLITTNFEIYNTYGICQSVTFPRINTVITGIRPDGSKYSDGIPCNLKYFQTDMVEKYEKDDDGNYLPYVSETLRADLSNYIETLIELQDGINLPSERTAVILDSVGIDELMEADTAKLQTVYMDLDTIETSAKQERFINRLRNHGVEFRNIPKYYYKEVA